MTGGSLYDGKSLRWELGRNHRHYSGRQLPAKQHCLRTEAKIEVGGCIPLLSPGVFTLKFVHTSRMLKPCSQNPDYL